MTWKHFELSEFTCRCGCGANLIDERFVDVLDALRDDVGFPLPVTSGYRCPTHNARVSSTGENGPHTTGRAVDLRVSRGNAFDVVRAAMALGFTGIGVKQHGSSRYLHLDDLPNASGQPRPTIWSYP